MEIIGIAKTTNKKGETTTTIHVKEDFESFQNDPQNGRTAVGHKAASIYLGTLAVPDLKVGMRVDVFYDKAVTLADGRQIQTVKKLEILK